MSTVKILVCYHKKDVLLKDDIFTPIHVGRALVKQNRSPEDPEMIWMLENLIGDDTGENISLKNGSYNELTAIYWAWKNYDVLGNPDYIGLMHYRRHFIFRESYSEVETVTEIDDTYYKRINYSPEIVEHLFDDYDYAAHIGHVSEVYSQYKDHHRIEDLDKVLSIVKRKYPDYKGAIDAYIHMSDANLCNMFIMPRAMFFEYCSWLFDVLSEFESTTDLSEKRLFISERLTGIFVENQRGKGMRLKSLPSTFIQAVQHIPVAIPYCESVFRTAVTMASIMKHAEETTVVDFVILCGGKVDETPLRRLVESYWKHSINFIDVNSVLEEKHIDASQFTFPEQFPLVVSEIINKNKIFYFDERVLLFDDIGRFSVWCNNDEYAILTLSGPDGRALGKIYSLNAARIRKHKLLQKVNNCVHMSSIDVFVDKDPSQLFPFPSWSFTITNKEKDGRLIYPKRRGDERWGVWNHAILYYDDGMEPWLNIQGLYSIYWWEVASEIPSFVPFDCTGQDAAELWENQSSLLAATIGKKKRSVNVPAPVNTVSSRSQRRPMFAPNSLIGRAITYYRNHGLKQTVRRMMIELKGE